MANYLSRPYQPSAPVSRGNINLDMTVLNTLQSRYDANKAIVDQAMSQYEMLKGLRPEDNSYIAAKVAEAKAQIDKFGNMRFEHKSSVDTVMSTLKNVLEDPIVKDAIQSRASYEQYNAEASKRREKNDGSYSDLNYQYGLYKGGFNDYMQGKSNKLGSMAYTPFTDYRKELKDIAENIDKYDTDIKKSWSEGGYIYTREGKVITEDKIKNIAESFLTDGAKQQLTISGWGSIHQGNTEEERQANTLQAFKSYSTSKLADEKSKLLLYQSEAKKTGLDEDKKNAELAQENYNNVEKRLNEIAQSGNFEQMYGTVYRDTTVGNFAKTIAYNTVDITEVKGDTTYMAQMKMAYDRERDAIKDAQWQANYQLKAKEAGLLEDGSAFQTRTDFGQETPEAGNVEQKVSEEIDGLNTTIDAKVNSIFSTLDKETQEAIDAEVSASKGLKTRADVLVEYNQGSLVSAEDADTLNGLITERYVKQEAYNKHAKAVDKEAEALLDSPELYKDLFNKPNIKIMWKSNSGKEMLFSAKDILLANGIVNEKGEKIQSKPGVREAIKKSLLADKILSRGYNHLDTNLVKQLALQFNENTNQVLLENDLSKYEDYFGKGNTPGTIEPYSINPNSKTGKFIIEQQKQGGYNKAGIFSADDSFDDISSVSSFFDVIDPSSRKAKIGKRLMEDNTVPFGKTTTVMPGTPEYKLLAQQAGFNIGDKTPIEIKKIPNQPDMVTITLGQGSASKIKPTEVNNEQKILIKDLPQTVLKQIDLYNTKSKFTVDNFPPMFQKATFTNKVGVHVTDVAKTFYGGDDRATWNRANLTTITGATNYYFENYSEMLGTVQKPTELGVAIKNVINSQNTYIETQKTKVGNRTYILPIIKKGDTIVFAPDAVAENLVTNENADSTQRMIKFLPQDYVNKYINSVLASGNQNQIDNIIKLYGGQ